MEIYVNKRDGTTSGIEEYLQKLEENIAVLQATIVQLEYQIKTQITEEPEEVPKSDYNKLKEEILEEVNLVISDLL